MRKSVERGRREEKKEYERGNGWWGTHGGVGRLNIRVSFCKTRLATRPQAWRCRYASGFGGVGVMQYRPGQAEGTHGGDSVGKGESGGLRAQG